VAAELTADLARLEAGCFHAEMLTARMQITEKDVLYVADLANLELTPEERARMVRDLSSILTYISHLNELDTADVPAMAQVSTQYAGPAAELGRGASYAQRDDVLRPSLPHEEALNNAPETDGDFFKVPKVIEK
jgi:aspartyl-tRNA(Asn)/glutamyl-tRNA(Gln) amidotransferase subunit C